MKHVKAFLVAAALAGTMAFVAASPASATVLTDENGAQYGVGTAFDLLTEGPLVLESTIGKIECRSTLRGQITKAGNAAETVSGPIENNLPEEPLFFECNANVVTPAKGILEIHTEEANPNNNGTLTSTGLEITTELNGFHCIYRTSSTDLGKLTGSKVTGGKATVDIKAILPRTGGRSGAFCGTTASLAGSYIVETPGRVDVD